MGLRRAESGRAGPGASALEGAPADQPGGLARETHGPRVRLHRPERAAAVARARAARSLDVPEAAGLRFGPPRARGSEVLLQRLAGLHRLRRRPALRWYRGPRPTGPGTRPSAVVPLEPDGEVRARPGAGRSWKSPRQRLRAEAEAWRRRRSARPG